MNGNVLTLHTYLAPVTVRLKSGLASKDPLYLQHRKSCICRHCKSYICQHRKSYICQHCMNEDVLTGGRLHLSSPAALDLPPSSHFHSNFCLHFFQMWFLLSRLNSKKVSNVMFDIYLTSIYQKNGRLFAPVNLPCKSQSSASLPLRFTLS